MFFNHVTEAPPDPIFGLTGAFQADVRPYKVNLLVGIYRDEHSHAALLPAVKRAKIDSLDQDMMADYLPIDGMHDFVDELGMLIFGEGMWKEAHGRIYGTQTVGGTGALRVGAEFLAQELGKTGYVPNPTWPSHRTILERAGFQVENYTYYSKDKRSFDLEHMLKDLKNMPEKSVVILHAACHNPTGCDPTIDEWGEISRIMKKRKLFPFFDFAYQGVGDGLEKDAQAVRLFLRDGHEMAIGYSCAKNFSLYCQRVGALFIVDENAGTKPKIGSQVKRIIRSMYSNPPAHGAKIVHYLLKTPELRTVWEQELNALRERIISMRKILVEHLMSRSTGHDFSYLSKHKGMFSFIDLNKIQTQRLIDQYAIYLIDTGRINVAGLNMKNIDYVVDSLLAVCAHK